MIDAIDTFIDYTRYVVQGNAQALFFLVLAFVWGGLTFIESGRK